MPLAARARTYGAIVEQMTRRTWFASMAALFGAKSEVLGSPVLQSPGPSAVYKHAQFGLGINISSELLEADDYDWFKHAVAAAGGRQRRREEEMFAQAWGPGAE